MTKNINLNSQKSKGFTLIELLIVIAILGVLAVVVLLALNPVQQLARTRDSGRISGITQLGHALEAYATSNNGWYPEADGTTPGCTPQSWIGCLVGASEIATVPAGIGYSIGGINACASNVVSTTWCYLTTGNASDADYDIGPVLGFSRLEADANIRRCQNFNNTTNAYAVYHTGLGRGGIHCGNADPTVAGVTAATLLP